MENIMMRELSKKDAELTAAYAKVEEQARQLSVGIGSAAATESRELSREQDRREAAEHLADQERSLRLAAEEQLSALRMQAGVLSSAVSEKDETLRRLEVTFSMSSEGQAARAAELEVQVLELQDALRKARSSQAGKKSAEYVRNSPRAAVSSPRTPGRLRAPPTLLSPSRRVRFSPKYVEHIMDCSKSPGN
eukprot:TRINITY_DN13260_c0_g1_i1.p1 TRINITY_DN13260_c0_g1~~TRINITY_DN13260_c0_g1_i1.p1  ORF type:complete len:192 (+),score=53.82 TRINITY_DN13260_c0_g1_i1:630-1205(+)